MDIRLTSTVLQIFAHDVQRSLEFYRLLGLAIPESNEPHVAVALPGGNTLSFDTEETIAGVVRSGLGAAHLVGKPVGAGLQGVDDPGQGRRALRKGHHRRPRRTPARPFDAPWGMRLRRWLTPTGNWVDSFSLLTLTQRGQRYSGKVPDLQVQVRLVGIPGQGGRLEVPAARRRAAAPRNETAGSAATFPDHSRTRCRTDAAGCGSTSPPHAPHQ